MIKLYKKWKAEQRFRRSAERMTELGQEILYALQHDEWRKDTYTITHLKSGLALWMCNGFNHFHIHGIKGVSFSDEVFKAMLSSEDLDVLWHYAMKVVRQHDVAPATAVLNALRLSQHKTEKQA